MNSSPLPSAPASRLPSVHPLYWLLAMALAHVPDPDLLIRTGGEMRLSNFLLWQAAYAELYFTDALWPDFDETDIDAAIQAYRQRDRRYGGIPTEELVPQGT